MLLSLDFALRLHSLTLSATTLQGVSVLVLAATSYRPVAVLASLVVCVPCACQEHFARVCGAFAHSSVSFLAWPVHARDSGRPFSRLDVSRHPSPLQCLCTQFSVAILPNRFTRAHGRAPTPATRNSHGASDELADLMQTHLSISPRKRQDMAGSAGSRSRSVCRCMLWLVLVASVALNFAVAAWALGLVHLSGPVAQYMAMSITPLNSSASAYSANATQTANATHSTNLTHTRNLTASTETTHTTNLTEPSSIAQEL